MVVSADTQPYSYTEADYVRDTNASEWAAIPDLEAEIVEADAMGDSLEPGVHVAKVVTEDKHGREYSEALTFEVVDERPPKYLQSELFN